MIHTTYLAALEGRGQITVDPDDDDLVVAVLANDYGVDEDVVDKLLQSLAPPEELLEAFETVQEAAENDPNVDDPRAVAWNSVNVEEQYIDHLRSGKLEPILENLQQHQRLDDDIWLATRRRDPQHSHRRLLAEELLRGRDQEPEHHPEPGAVDEEETVPDARLDEFETKSLAGGNP